MRCKGISVDNLHPDGTELAEGCNGCGGSNFDCWTSPMSVHILGTDCSRESDKRLDWQSEYMHGRLPYNAYGLLQDNGEDFLGEGVGCLSSCPFFRGLIPPWRLLGKPYLRIVLFQLGPESKDVVECNSRCKCGMTCKNRELQRGLQVPLELFKTTDRGWGVRSLQQIPRCG